MHQKGSIKLLVLLSLRLLIALSTGCNLQELVVKLVFIAHSIVLLQA